MGVSNSTPIMCTTPGAALYVAGSVISITCGTTNVIGIIRQLVDAARYINWNKNKIAHATNPELYFQMMSIVHMFTYLRIHGAGNSGQTPLDTETFSRKVDEHVTEDREKKVSRDGRVISQQTNQGKQANSLDKTHASTWVTKGPTKSTNTTTIDESVGPSGAVVRTKTELNVTSNSSHVNQLYVVSVGAEFEFTLKFAEETTSTSSSGKQRKTKVNREFTYWIRIMKSKTYTAYPDIYVHTNKKQPTAFAHLLNLQLEIPVGDDGQFAPQQFLLDDTPNSDTKKITDD